MTDPFPPSPIEYSMDVDEVIPPPKYANFKDMSHEDKMTILSDEMVFRGTKPVELMLRDTGIEWDEYRELCNDPVYIKDLKDKSLRLLSAPNIPELYKDMSERAISGDATSRKDMLNAIGAIAPEGSVLINQNLINMTDEEIEMEIRSLLPAPKDDDEEA